MPDETREIDCQAAVRQLWDYLDAELHEPQRQEVAHHLATCQACLRHAEFGQRLIGALLSLRDRHPLPASVRAAVVAALVEAGYSGP